MIKKLLLFSVFFLFLFLVIFNVIYNPSSFSENIITSLSIWLFNVYPALFTFYIISSCLINFDIIKKISFIAKPFVKFENQKAYELFITGIFVGNPSITSLIMNEYEVETISLNDTKKLLKTTSFFNPLFIITIVCGAYLYHIKYALIILVSILLTNLLIGMFIKSEKIIYGKQKPINPTIRLDTIFNAINQAITLLLLVAGIMVFANILKFSVIYFLDLLKINSPVLNFFTSLFEVSTGLVDIFNTENNILILFPIATFMFAFQGVSVNMQVLNIIYEHKIKFLPIFMTRIIQGLISGCITFIILNII